MWMPAGAKGRRARDHRDRDRGGRGERPRQAARAPASSLPALATDAHPHAPLDVVSFGHSAAAFAFATGACAKLPALAPVLVPLAGTVAYFIRTWEWDTLKPVSAAMRPDSTAATKAV